MRNLFTTVGALAALALLPLTAQEEGKGAPPVKAVDGGKLEQNMIGYWAPDPKAMLERIKKELGDDPDAAATLPLIQAMMQNMAVQVEKGEVSIHVMGEMQSATYIITKVDEESKTLTMQVKDDDGAGEGTATIDGDKLTLSKDGEDIILNRIKKEEFEKRKQAAQDAPVFPALE